MQKHMQKLAVLLALLFAALVPAYANADALVVPPPGYTYTATAGCPFAGVSYAPCDDQMQRLAGALDKARAEDKLLLIVLGADWCPWCRSLEKLLPSSEVLTRLDAQFDYAGRYRYTNIATSAVANGKRVAVPSGMAVESFLLGRSKVPRVSQGIPYLVILDPKSGEVVHQGTGDLEDTFNVAQTHDTAKIRDVLRAAHAELRPRTSELRSKDRSSP
jgi:thiol-disulfide isomerase/thioredoxin